MGGHVAQGAADFLQQLLGDLAAAGGPIEHVEALAGGTANTCLALRLRDGREVVAKIEPPPGRRLGHEQRLLRAEVEFLRLAATLGLPVPDVVATRFGRDGEGRDAIVLTRLPGAPLRLIEPSLAAPVRRQLRRELGRLAARLGSIEGERFGQPSLPAPAGASWRDTLQAMFARLWRDAERFGVDLPVDEGEVERLIAGARGLDAVTTPRLVHFDLWDGNVLVDVTGDAPRVTGILDGERWMWGDPFADMASLSLRGGLDRAREVRVGWSEVARAPDPGAEADRERVLVPQLYLYLVMRVEAVARGREVAAQRALLDRAILRLAAQLGTSNGHGGRPHDDHIG